MLSIGLILLSLATPGSSGLELYARWDWGGGGGLSHTRAQLGLRLSLSSDLLGAPSAPRRAAAAREVDERQRLCARCDQLWRARPQGPLARRARQARLEVLGCGGGGSC